MRKALFVFIATVTLGLTAVPGAAATCDCGYFKGPAVAHGTSPSGVPWRIKAIHLGLAEEKEEILVECLVGDAISGRIAELSLPISSRFVFGAESRGEIDEYPESDICGVTAARALEMQVTMNDGEVLTIKSTPAPPALRKRFPWLGGMRFFDVFYLQSEEPTLVTAFDRSGEVVGRSKSHRVAFLREPDLFFFSFTPAKDVTS